MKLINLAIISLFLLFSPVFATDNSSYHVFNAGETISSSKMNENFQRTKSKIDNVDTKLNSIQDNITQLNQQIGSLGGSLLFPDGFWGTPKTLMLSSSINYTVPLGKTFYITYFIKPSLYFNGDEYLFRSTESEKFYKINPAIVKENTIISSIYDDSYITGFEVDKGVEVVNVELDSCEKSFTVPSDKTLYILTVSKRIGDNRDALYIQRDSSDIYNSNGIKLFETHQYLNSISYPLIITEGLTICSSGAGYKKYITGYLK